MQKTIKLTTSIFIFFILLVFYLSLNKVSNYDTENLVGNKLNQIKLESLKGINYITNENLKKNSYTLINFWASWCAPCRDEHAMLVKLNNDEKNLKILGVNFKDKKNNALKFLKDLGDPYDDIARDEFGKYSINFGIYGIPESILVNKDLIIIKKFIGPISKNDYNFIKQIVRKQ